MDKDVKMLLKLILAEEEESEAGQHNPYPKKTNREMLSSIVSGFLTGFSDEESISLFVFLG